jgi:hypothetical protein
MRTLLVCTSHRLPWLYGHGECGLRQVLALLTFDILTLADTMTDAFFAGMMRYIAEASVKLNIDS